MAKKNKKVVKVFMIVSGLALLGNEGDYFSQSYYSQFHGGTIGLTSMSFAQRYAKRKEAEAIRETLVEVQPESQWKIVSVTETVSVREVEDGHKHKGII